MNNENKDVFIESDLTGYENVTKKNLLEEKKETKNKKHIKKVKKIDKQ
jgi:hypothetical protein